MKNLIIAFTLTAALFMSACKTNIEPVAIKSGSADFTRYVAIGNSLTAGYTDGALSLNGQQNSYPLMLAQQFKLAGGGDFRVPYMNDGAGNDGNNVPSRILGYVLPCNSTIPTLSPILNPNGATPLNNVAAAGPYNLIGIPGAKATDAVWNLYSMFNPFLKRIVTTPGTTTMIDEAVRLNPTFYTLWLGNNDVLLYAIGGAVAPTTSFSPRLTPDSAVASSLALAVEQLSRTGAKGAIANVPNVTSVPFFTTIPWNGAVLTKGKADTLNAAYALAGLTHITWKEGSNGFVIYDSTASANMRQATSGDYILLTTPSDSLRCAQWGTNPLKPLKDQYVLDSREVQEINAATNAYNSSIASLAVQKGLALVDMNNYLQTVKSGLLYNGVDMNATFVSGGIFSLDGIHPTPRGYALIANHFIRAINAKFGSSLPEVDVTSYRGVLFP